MPRLKLSDVAKINMGQSPSSETYNTDRNGLPFYQGNVDFGEKYPSARIWCDKPTKIAEPDDILISVRAPIGALNYAKEECCIGRGLAAITPDANKTSPEFIYWLLRANHAYLNRMGTGSTFKAINRKTLEDITLPNYKKDEQYDIAKILSKIDDAIRSKKSQIKQLDELIKARFVEMFSDEKCELLQDLSEKVTDGSHMPPKGVDKSEYMMLSSQNIFNELNFEGIRYLSKEDFENENRRTNIQNGDVLITIVGTIGRTHVVKKNEKFVFQRSVGVIKPVREKINGVYLSAFLQTNRARSFLDSGAHGSSQKGIYLQDLKKLPVPVAPIDKQNQFADFVAQVDKSKFALSNELAVCNFYVRLIYDCIMHGCIDLRMT